MVCKFCNIPYEAKYQKKPNDELLEVIKLAENDIARIKFEMFLDSFGGNTL
jgi:radical SAM superfamily enzyme YgiQ (UPF0313 family)